MRDAMTRKCITMKYDTETLDFPTSFHVNSTKPRDFET
jgi:hypothetical protein